MLSLSFASLRFSASLAGLTRVDAVKLRIFPSLSSDLGVVDLFEETGHDEDTFVKSGSLDFP